MAKTYTNHKDGKQSPHKKNPVMDQQLSSVLKYTGNQSIKPTKPSGLPPGVGSYKSGRSDISENAKEILKRRDSK